MATTSSNLDLQSPPPARFITLSVHAGEVFANQEKALSWLHSANPSLAGRTPLEAAVTEEGFAEADDILTRLATVCWADACVPVVPRRAPGL